MDVLASEPCKCCGGTGVQVRNDGIKILCPACGGKGQLRKYKSSTDWFESIPYCPHIGPRTDWIIGW